MKILMLGWELPPHNSGGLGVACFEMTKALALKGASIDFVVPYKADYPDAHFMKVLSATNYSVKNGYISNAYGHSGGSVSSVSGDATLRGLQKTYGEYVKQHVDTSSDYDAIHAHDWLTMEAAIEAKNLTGIPMVVHVHATEFDRAGGETGDPLIHEIEQQGLLMADRIIAVSAYTKSIIVSRYGIPADKVEVVHNAIDAASFLAFDYDRRTYTHLEQLKAQDYSVIVFVGRLSLQKGLTHLLRATAKAIERHERIVLLLAGDGEQRNELLELVAELGIADKVYFTGFIRGQQWRDAFNVADIFIMSSVSEPFGITALEAAHHSNAIILTKQSGVGEVLHSVFRYDFWDVDALADRIIALSTSRALRDTMTENVKQEYDRLSWHDVAQTCLDLYKNLRTGVTA